MLLYNYYHFLLLLLFILNLIYSLYVYKIDKNGDNNYILKLILGFFEIFKEKAFLEFFFFFIVFFPLFFIINLLTFLKTFLTFFKIIFYKITKKTVNIKIKEFPWNSLGYTIGYTSIFTILGEIYKIIKFQINKNSFLINYSFFSKNKNSSKNFFNIKIFELIVLRWIFNIPVLYLIKCIKLSCIYKKFSKATNDTKTYKIKFIIKFKNIFSALALFFKDDLKINAGLTDYFIFEKHKIIIYKGKISVNGKKENDEVLKFLKIKQNPWIMNGSLIDKKRDMLRDPSGEVRKIKDHLFFKESKNDFNCSLTTSDAVLFNNNKNNLEKFKTKYVWNLKESKDQYFCLYKENSTFEQRFITSEFIKKKTWHDFNFNLINKYLSCHIRTNLYLQNVEFDSYLSRGFFSETIITNNVENIEIKNFIKDVTDETLIDFCKNSEPLVYASIIDYYEKNKKNALDDEDFLEKFKDL